MTSSHSLFKKISLLIVSVPIFIKIIGIVFLVATLFGGLISFQTMISLKRILQLEFESGSSILARNLEINLEKHMVTENYSQIQAYVDNMMTAFPEVEYIIVWDEFSHPIAHTLSGGVPRELVNRFSEHRPDENLFRVFDSDNGLIYDRLIPVLKGRIGYLQVGVNTSIIDHEMSILSNSIFHILCIAIFVGFLLAIALTRLVTQPVSHLVKVTRRIRDGDFDAKAKISTHDEIGQLSFAMNELTHSLRDYRQQVKDKEKRLQQLINRIVAIQEQERLLISRELHDEVGHSVLSLLLILGPERPDEIPGLRQKLQDLVATIRHLAWGLRPAILDDYGLDSALSKYTQEQSLHSGIRLDYSYRRVGKVGNLPKMVNISLYRVVQESFANIVRYAKVDSASLSIIHEPAKIMLLMEDSGVGFDTENLKKSDWGLGLMGMRERIETIGGTFYLESYPHKGTIIQIEVPLTELITDD
jgi:signal transduction histidine kinase